MTVGGGIGVGGIGECVGVTVGGMGVGVDVGGGGSLPQAISVMIERMEASRRLALRPRIEMPLCG